MNNNKRPINQNVSPYSNLNDVQLLYCTRLRSITSGNIDYGSTTHCTSGIITIQK
jgi:hypothetical protein